MEQKMMPTQAVYVHIPFCRQKCLYCDFASYAGCSEQQMTDYAEAVCAEIAGRAAEGKNVAEKATIYFGGGTPSTLPTNSLAKIVHSLKAAGFWRNPAEATIEVNPGTADLEKLCFYRNLGFDRISFGVQSLNDTELKTIGRIHSAADALEALELARRAGFKRISADLIYGLPGQTLASLKGTLEQLLETGLEHMSVYGLIVEEGTPLEHLVESGKLVLPDEDTSADMYELVQAMLKKSGFQRYEISNYAKNKQCSRHNLVYWQYHPYAAFGAAAAGFDGMVRRSATEEVLPYIKEVDALYGSERTEKERQAAYTRLYMEEELTNEELFGEYMFMGLRRAQGADLKEAQERFGVNVWGRYEKQLQPLIEHQLLVYDKENAYLRLTESGMAVGNQIFEIFL